MSLFFEKEHSLWLTAVTTTCGEVQNIATISTALIKSVENVFLHAMSGYANSG